MAQHIVSAFDVELDRINTLVNIMGAKVNAQLESANEMQRAPRPELVEQVVQSDHEVDELQLELEEKVIETIARRQPLANDLRQLIATLKIATDLERIGDLAKNNCRRAQAASTESQPRSVAANLQVLGKLAETQLERTLDAFARRDDKLAQEVWAADSELDTLHTSLFRELLTYMMEDPRNIGYCTHLLFCARNLERIGDHATNIVEQVHFIVTGQVMPLDRPKGENSSELKPI